MADDAKKPAIFSRASAKRIAAVVRRVEHASRNGPPPRGKYPVGDDGGGQVATVTTAVTARSGSTAGAGVVTFQDLNSSGVYVAGLTGIAVKNPYSSTIAVGKWVTLVSASGEWTVFGADCP